MSTPFVGQVAIFSFSFAPKGWAICAGQLLPINQNQALFSLLGTAYGGDGVSTFGLPNLQGACVVGVGTGFTLGMRGGEASHTLQSIEIPSHQHTLYADGSTPASSNTTTPVGNGLGIAEVVAGNDTPALNVYTTGGTNGTTLDSSSIGMTGGQAHQNMMPTLGTNYCIALVGIYPSRN